MPGIKVVATECPKNKHESSDKKKVTIPDILKFWNVHVFKQNKKYDVFFREESWHQLYGKHQNDSKSGFRTNITARENEKCLVFLSEFLAFVVFVRNGP